MAWNVVCLTCEDRLPEWFFGFGDVKRCILGVHKIVSLAAAVKEIQFEPGDLIIEYDSHVVNLAWFQAHSGHQIVGRNSETGTIYAGPDPLEVLATEAVISEEET